MKQLRMTLLLVATSMLQYACLPDKGHRNITFVNISESKISCQELSSGNITEADTLFDCGVGAVGIPANSSYNISSLDNFGWEADFNVIPYLQISVMDGETYRKYLAEPCDTIQKYAPILQRYRLTLEDLQRLDWTITYPPTEAMKDVKMYPPYKPN